MTVYCVTIKFVITFVSFQPIMFLTYYLGCFDFFHIVIESLNYHSLCFTLLYLLLTCAYYAFLFLSTLTSICLLFIVVLLHIFGLFSLIITLFIVALIGWILMSLITFIIVVCCFCLRFNYFIAMREKVICWRCFNRHFLWCIPLKRVTFVQKMLRKFSWYFLSL